jgi:hypothetical protein
MNIKLTQIFFSLKFTNFIYPLPYVCPYPFPVFFTSIALTGKGQQITNVIPQAVGDKIIVHYDIEDTKENQVFEVALYSSYDNFLKSILSVSGNGVGNQVTGGSERVIIWDVLKDLNELNGEFRLKYVPWLRPG